MRIVPRRLEILLICLLFLGFGASTAFPKSVFLDTNLFSLLSRESLLVSPYTNLPPEFLKNPFYFCPLNGPDYVRQAVLSLPQSANRLSVGGGCVTFVGINFTPVPIVLTNTGAASGGAMSWHLTAPAFVTGGLVGTVNPVIRIGANNVGVSAQIDNLLIASTANQPTNLIEAVTGFGRLWINNNWIGLWQAMANNQDTYGPAGLTPATTSDDMTGNLVIAIGGAGDKVEMNGNSIIGINGIYWFPDHGAFCRNMFSDCGHGAAWPATSVLSLGACFYYVPGIHTDLEAVDNYFYNVNNGYCFLGDSATGNNVQTWGDSFENVNADAKIVAQYLVGPNAHITVNNPHINISGYGSQGPPNAVVFTHGPAGYQLTGITPSPDHFRLVDFLNDVPSLNFPLLLKTNLTVLGTNYARVFAGSGAGLVDYIPSGPAAPTSLPSLWNSNKSGDLYWVTLTTTNKLAGP